MTQDKAFHWLSGPGEMAERIRRHDWREALFGGPSDWPTGLRGALSLMLDNPHPACLAWGPDLIVFYNDAFIPLLDSGHPEALGRPFATVLPEVWTDCRAGIGSTLQGSGQLLAETQLAMTGNQDVPAAWFRFSLTPLRDDKGAVAGLFCVAIETPEQRLQQLVRELDHRAKNVLAVLQAVVRLTKADSMDDFVSAVDGRVGSLARSHSLLAQSQWQGADLQELIEAELESCLPPGDRVRLRLAGPPLTVTAPATQTLAMVIHELASNAAKYGALSIAGGTVEVTWEMSAQSVLFAWTESGGPPVRPPTRKGFGTMMIDGALTCQLDGTVESRWHREGLQCLFSVSAKQILPERRGPRRSAPDPRSALSA